MDKELDEISEKLDEINQSIQSLDATMCLIEKQLKRAVDYLAEISKR